MLYKIHYVNCSEEIQQKVAKFEEQWLSSLEYILVQTSGSTGTPKTISLSKDKMRLSARMTADFLNLQPGETALLCLSPDTIAGKMMLVRSFEIGLNLIITNPTNNPLEHIEEQIDFLAIVPLQLHELITTFPEELKSIKNCIVGGGIVTEALERKLSENHCTLFQTFGMTETISHIAMKKIGLLKEEYYTVLPGNSIEEIEGKLQIKSPLLDEPILTNDLIKKINHQQFIWLGRADFVINSGGIKLQVEVLESKLSNLIEKPFFLSGIPDEKLGEQLVLCIQSEHVLSNLNKAFFSHHLNKYEIPKFIYYYTAFEFTASQKINRLNSIKNKPYEIQAVL